MMSYTANYTDEFGNTRVVSITNADSLEALKNDYNEIMRKYNPKYVTIERVQAVTGQALHLKVTVMAPSHFLTSTDDTSPKPCKSMQAHIICNPGYPLEKVSAYYSKNHYLASPNVFRGGGACIDHWIPFTSSLTTVVDKLVRDMIHDPCVTRYDSMANSSVSAWHKKGVEEGRFPTIDPKLLYAPEAPRLPSRRTISKPIQTPPPLPGRRH